MPQKNDAMTISDQAAGSGSPALAGAIFTGIVAGTLANITALVLGYSFWIGLLCHSLFGALGMGIALVRVAGKPQQHRASKGVVTSQVRSVRH